MVLPTRRTWSTRAPVKNLSNLRFSALEGLRLAAGPHALDPLSADTLVYAVGDSFDLWKLRHPRPLRSRIPAWPLLLLLVEQALRPVETPGGLFKASGSLVHALRCVCHTLLHLQIGQGLCFQEGRVQLQLELRRLKLSPGSRVFAGRANS